MEAGITNILHSCLTSAGLRWSSLNLLILFNFKPRQLIEKIIKLDDKQVNATHQEDCWQAVSSESGGQPPAKLSSLDIYISNINRLHNWRAHKLGDAKITSRLTFQNQSYLEKQVLPARSWSCGEPLSVSPSSRLHSGRIGAASNVRQRLN